MQHDTAVNPKFVIIWLHGLGSDGNDFADVIPQLAFQLPAPIRCIFPHSPQRAVTINGGAIMPAWYDIRSLQTERDINYSHLDEARDSVVEIIQKQVDEGFSLNNIIVGGFSQGGAVAVDILLSAQLQIGAYIILSSYIARKPISVDESIKKIPLFLSHGIYDEVVPYILGERAQFFFLKYNFLLSWKEYPITHTVSETELNDIAFFVSQNFNPYKNKK